MKAIGALLVTAGLAVAACGDGDASDIVEQLEETDVQRTIEDGVSDEDAERLNRTGSSLREALEDVDTSELTSLFSSLDLAQVQELTDGEPYTMFAPNDAGFASLDTDQMADILADHGKLRELLRDHVVDERLLAADLDTEETVTSVGGLRLEFDTTGATPTVNGIEIVRTDLTTDNGVIHIIAGVLTEPGS
jgi:uncharacterized surface protein with fasciclin (FAS1) repeats